MKMRSTCAAAALCLLLCARPLPAEPVEGEPPPDQQLVHLDTPRVLQQGALGGRLDLRVFGDDENLSYFGAGVQYGLGHGLQAMLRGAFAGRKDFALPGGVIRHGGSDVELAAKYSPGRYPRLAALVGVSFADTPAQSDAFVTLGLMGDADLGSSATVYLNPRAVLIDDNQIVGIGVGARVRLGRSAALVADWTPIVHGQNTRDTATGGMRHRDIYGVALRFTPSPRSADLSIDLGYGNGLGSTTGFGLTPGLGGGGAFYLAVSARR